MNKNSKIKLELMRLEGIRKLIYDKVEETLLEDIYLSVMDSYPQNIKKALKNLNRKNLIDIISMASKYISDEDINETYEQFRYGLKPGFTLFVMNGKYKAIGITQVKTEIQNYCAAIEVEEDATFRNFKFKNCIGIKKDVYEFSFSYGRKHNYISEDEEPCSIYEYQESFAWVDNKNQYIAIKNCDEKIVNIIKNAFSHIYGVRCSNIKLNKKIIDEVFDLEGIKKASYMKANASEMEAEKIIISDSKLSEKQSVKTIVDGYDMVSSNIMTEVAGDGANTLGINCEKGKLYLSSNVSATSFRNWSIDSISKIINYINDAQNDYEDWETFHMKGPTTLDIWDDFKRKPYIEKICYKVYMAINNGMGYADIELSTKELLSALKGHSYMQFRAYCSECGESTIPHCSCGSYDFKLKENQIECLKCGAISTVICENGHKIEIQDPSELIAWYPDGELLGNIKETLSILYHTKFTNSFYIYDNKVIIVEMEDSYLIDKMDIKELRRIINEDIDTTKKAAYVAQLKSMKEKCTGTKYLKCNNCDYTKDDICIMKLFINNDSYTPAPHHGSEFGDVSFPVTYKGQITQLMCIAKSAVKGETLTVSSKEGREMIQQILTASHDTRVGIIGALCPIRFHDQLIEELRYLANLLKKKMIIMDEKYMVKQLNNYYIEKRKNCHI